MTSMLRKLCSDHSTSRRVSSSRFRLWIPSQYRRHHHHTLSRQRTRAARPWRRFDTTSNNDVPCLDSVQRSRSKRSTAILSSGEPDIGRFWARSLVRLDLATQRQRQGDRDRDALTNMTVASTQGPCPTQLHLKQFLGRGRSTGATDLSNRTSEPPPNKLGSRTKPRKAPPPPLTGSLFRHRRTCRKPPTL